MKKITFLLAILISGLMQNAKAQNGDLNITNNSKCVVNVVAYAYDIFTGCNNYTWPIAVNAGATVNLSGSAIPWAVSTPSGWYWDWAIYSHMVSPTYPWSGPDCQQNEVGQNVVYCGASHNSPTNYTVCENEACGSGPNSQTIISASFNIVTSGPRMWDCDIVVW